VKLVLTITFSPAPTTWRNFLWWECCS